MEPSPYVIGTGMQDVDGRLSSAEVCSGMRVAVAPVSTVAGTSPSLVLPKGVKVEVPSWPSQRN
jgi:hypothetical protein